MELSIRLRTPVRALLRTHCPSRRLQQRRWLITSQPVQAIGTRKSITPTSTISDSERRRMPPSLVKKLGNYILNENIGAKWVQLRNQEGKLGEPLMLETVLKETNPETHVVRQLASGGPLPDTAIAEVIEISQLLKIASAKEEMVKGIEKQRKAEKPKQLELNWAISENDLNLKLKQLETFLEKGRRVDILLAAKRKQRKATQEEAESVIKRLRERIAEIGANELKMEGNLLGQAMITVQKKA